MYDPRMDVEHLGNQATSGTQNDENLHFSRYSRLPTTDILDIFPFIVKSDGTHLATLCHTMIKNNSIH